MSWAFFLTLAVTVWMGLAGLACAQEEKSKSDDTSAGILPPESADVAPAAPALASLISDRCVLLLHLPNISATRKAYRTSCLRQIMESPEMGSALDVLQKTQLRILSYGTSPAVGEKRDVLARELVAELGPLMDGEAFAGWNLFQPDPDSADPTLCGSLIAGVKPKGGPDVLDAFLEKARAAVLRFHSVPPESGTASVEGVEYQYFYFPEVAEKSPRKRVFFARHKGWVLMGFGESALADYLRRSSGKASGTSMADVPSVQKAWKQMHQSPDAEVMLNLLPIRDLMEQSPVSEVRNMGKAMGYIYGTTGISARFRGVLIEEKLASVEPPDAAIHLQNLQMPCDFRTMLFTSPTTLIYGAHAFNLSAAVKAFESYQGGSPDGKKISGREAMDGLRKAFVDEGMKFDDVIAGFGPEQAMVMDAQNSSFALYWLLRDPAKVQPLQDYLVRITNLYKRDLEELGFVIKEEKIADYKVLSFFNKKRPQTPAVYVTVGGGPLFAIITRRECAVEQLTKATPAALASPIPPAGTLAESAGFKSFFARGLPLAPAPAASAQPFAQPLSGAMYVDSPSFLEGAFSFGPMLMIFAGPQIYKAWPELADFALTSKAKSPQYATVWSMERRVLGDTAVTTSVSGLGNQLVPLGVIGFLSYVQSFFPIRAELKKAD
ncbi:MAG TPA: hypothetical protein VK970_15510 [Candidatus Methylacidiphilales bacterium]|nr:hypothetical protein [Candidatus Methylacidiphilales bacterium]